MARIHGFESHACPCRPTGKQQFRAPRDAADLPVRRVRLHTILVGFRLLGTRLFKKVLLDGV